MARYRWIKRSEVRRGYTMIYLTEAGRKALQRLTPAEHRVIVNELTAGGGYDIEEGIIYIVHTSIPVYSRWRKIREILREAYKRRKR